ncbi:Vacuolar protein-sorting-associated protein [Drechslerella dactyloides]|uniref:Vacuolar protein-sorting-associated protein n=1 Tax=Drechslerella dactyloides TaxID=74499 RepID=A0AAD6J6D2_DREDA|nr:Vacuolar protein-sorting-associated protein [Drechslerella dactyloides]
MDIARILCVEGDTRNGSSTQPYQRVNAAIPPHTILQILELMESILLYTPAVTVQTSCRRVCQLWKALIETSPALKYYTRTGLRSRDRADLDTTEQANHLPWSIPPLDEVPSPEATGVFTPMAMEVLAVFWRRLTPYILNTPIGYDFRNWPPLPIDLEPDDKVDGRTKLLRDRAILIHKQFSYISEHIIFLRYQYENSTEIDRNWVYPYLESGLFLTRPNDSDCPIRRIMRQLVFTERCAGPRGTTMRAGGINRRRLTHQVSYRADTRALEAAEADRKLQECRVRVVLAETKAAAAAPTTTTSNRAWLSHSPPSFQPTLTRQITTSLKDIKSTASVYLPTIHTTPSRVQQQYSTMDTLKGLFWKPDPAEQLRKCNSLIRSNARQLDRQIFTLKNLETKTKSQIKAASTRRTHTSSTPLEIRLLARELVRIRRQHARLTTSKAQLESVGMQVREAFAVRKIQGSMKVSTQVMKDVNALVKLPELTGTMRELSSVLVAANVMEEMAEDAMGAAETDFEDEEAEEEVDRVIAELVGDRFGEDVAVPEELPAANAQEPVATAEEQADLQEWRSRLEQLRS